MVKYYPPESELDIAKLIREYPELELVNQKEEVRLADLADRKKRGKGPPKKTKNKGEWFASVTTTRDLTGSCIITRRKSEDSKKTLACGRRLLYIIV